MRNVRKIAIIIEKNDNQNVTDLLEKCVKRGDNLFATLSKNVPSGYGNTVEYVCTASGGYTIYRTTTV